MYMKKTSASPPTGKFSWKFLVVIIDNIHLCYHLYTIVLMKSDAKKTKCKIRKLNKKKCHCHQEESKRVVFLSCDFFFRT